MTKKLIFAVTLMIVLAFGLFAADVTGKWTAQVPGRGGQGTRDVTFTLKADGANLTGSMTGFQGNEIPITEGKVTGDNVSFVIVQERNGNTMKQSYSGAVSGDELKLKVEGGRGPQEMTAKRAK
jgi:hypothetical protein